MGLVTSLINYTSGSHLIYVTSILCTMWMKIYIYVLFTYYIATMISMPLCK